MFWFCWCYPQLEIGCQALHHSFHVTPIRPKFVLAVLWLHHNCCSYKLYRLEWEQPAQTTADYPPRCWFGVTPLDVVKEKILTPPSRLDPWNVSLRGFEVRLWWIYFPMHSSVGRSLNINTAGSFRKITFRRQDWTMVNMSYRQFLLNYPHSSSRQSRRRANKRKRVSVGSC